MEMGQLELECVNLDIRELAKEVNNLLSLQMEFRGLHYSCQIDDSVPAEIWSDPNRILQVLLNLIENAIKYNKAEGSITLTIKSLPEISKDAVEVTVKDTGKGIDLERLNTLFSLDEIGSEKRSTKRVSVSLPVAFEICKKLGSELKVNTQLGVGSSFAFQIIPKRGPEEREEEQLSEDSQGAEWDLEEDSFDVPVIHRPLRSGRTKALCAHYEAELEPSARKEGTRGSRWAHGRGDSLEMRMRRSPQFGGEKDRRSITDIVPEREMTSGTTSQLRTKQLMMQEILRMSETPKRSFSSGDVVRKGDKNDNTHKDANMLRQTMVCVKKFSAFIRQTIRRDRSSIRNNIIRSKNELFIPMSMPRRRALKTATPLRKTEALPPSTVRSIRHTLLSLHLDNEAAGKLSHCSEVPPNGNDNLLPSIDRIDECDEEEKAGRLPPKRPVRRLMCIRYIFYTH